MIILGFKHKAKRELTVNNQLGGDQISAGGEPSTPRFLTEPQAVITNALLHLLIVHHGAFA